MKNLRCVVLIQKRSLGTDVGISAFNLRDSPLFALVPKAETPRYLQLTKKLRNAHVIAWESAFRDSGRSLGNLLGRELEKSGQTHPLAGLDAVAAAGRREFIDHRLRGIDALPSLPGAISRILKLLADPDVNAEQLERVVLLDPGIVQRLFAVASSPAFAGRGGEVSSVRDAIVCLGLREVAAIVMQTSLASDFLRTQESLVDFKRFWAHLVACALTAHKIVSGKSIALKAEVQFHDYWTTCLLHVSNVITRGLGLSFPLDSETGCHENVLEVIGATQQDIDVLRDSIGPGIVAQVKELMHDTD